MLCFIIMPFAAEFDGVYDAIERAVLEAFPGGQARAFRMDQQLGAGVITDQMVDRLEQSDLVVADISGLNPNVMWELGFARAARKPRVIVGRTATTVPFDFSLERVHPYDPKQLGALKKLLKLALQETARTQLSADSHGLYDYGYNEVRELAAVLARRRIESRSGDIVALNELVDAVQSTGLRTWDREPAKTVMESVERKLKAGVRVDNLFWWLIVHGVLEYDQIQVFQVEGYDKWRDNIELVRLSHRGVRLLNAIARRDG